MPMPEFATDRLNLPQPYAQTLHRLFTQYLPIDTQVWAYGSRVRGDNHEASDLDLVVKFSEVAMSQTDALAQLREALTESDIPIIVQIVDWNLIPASFRDEILDGYVVV
jgi:predicted nucleotidyltransferase